MRFLLRKMACTWCTASIPRRKEILNEKRQELLASIAQLQKSIDYIDWKQQYYDNLLAGRPEDADA